MQAIILCLINGLVTYYNTIHVLRVLTEREHSKTLFITLHHYDVMATIFRTVHNVLYLQYIQGLLFSNTYTCMN